MTTILKNAHNTDLSQHFSVCYRQGHESERSQTSASQITLDESIRCSNPNGVIYSIKTLIISLSIMSHVQPELRSHSRLQFPELKHNCVH